jgi:hypothetical protein
MKYYLTLIAALAMVPHAHGITTFDFDGATPVTTIGTALPGAVTVANAYWETEDENGDPLLNPGFRADSVSPTVSLADPSVFGYGPAISGKALDATNGPVMFTFASAMNLSNFGVMLDNNTFGNPPITGGSPAFGTNILFYDSGDNLIGFIPLDQTVSGFTVTNDPGNFMNVSKVIMPSGAFYDNVSFTAQAIPEPTVAGMACLGALAMSKRRRA